MEAYQSEVYNTNSSRISARVMPRSASSSAELISRSSGPGSGCRLPRLAVIGDWLFRCSGTFCSHHSSMLCRSTTWKFDQCSVSRNFPERCLPKFLVSCPETDLGYKSFAFKRKISHRTCIVARKPFFNCSPLIAVPVNCRHRIAHYICSYWTNKGRRR